MSHTSGVFILTGFFLGLARNGLSAHPDEVPVSGFFGFLRFYTILRRDAWVFSYLPDEGGASVCEPLGARIQELGGAINLNARVTKLRCESQKYLVEWQSLEGMQSAMAYMVAMEDGEIVKVTADGFESTGMFVLSIDGAPVTLETFIKYAQVAINA